MSIIAVSKGVLLFLGSTFFVFGLTPPNPPPKEKSLIYKGQLFEKTFKLLICGGLASTLLAFCGNIVLLINGPPQPYAHHSNIVSKICPHPSSPSSFHNLAQVSLPFLLGTIALLLGSGTRLCCFHTLGKLFTYEVSIQPEHKLITSGPYGIVRHPSYTGLVVMLAGAAIACLSPGSYIQECNLMATNAKWFIGLWLSAAAFITVSLGRRGEVEDLALEKSFGHVWREYSERVSYRAFTYCNIVN
ncbi:hypothetical protein Clacol_009656 [Clathrus columnatus]|uniref:Protein-S-isoprenylcysteine O-methyltransferase n=1 Tax=Clathrus columnatus TaxID=1419009 RepID=A0AAV5ARH8_9AGAM|nr:hypothetical protein Clacol_009656 [Clathrus columnatus]